MNRPNRSVAFIGLYIAFCVVVGFLLAPIPNVELIMLMVFLGGNFFGAKFGALIGGASSFVFFAFNPWGSSLAFPPLFIAQIVSFGLTGLAGGIILRKMQSSTRGKMKVFIFGVSGGILTLIYHVFISLLVSGTAGFSLIQTGVILTGGLIFGLWHIGLNILFFASLTPVLIRVAQRFSFVNEFR